mmetsp:Transcript_82191/g.133385  ORF Transcript_82191/g.133385 Transcript_82191/m.133385 type:complete len:82 (-) Transcript_82191:221-466(-)
MYWLLLVRRCLVQLQLLLRIVSYLTTSTVLAQQRQMCFEPPVTSVLAQYWPWDRIGLLPGQRASDIWCLAVLLRAQVYVKW